MIIHSDNEKIYQQIYLLKALTEQVVGLVPHSFPFIKAHYEATFTNAVDFTLFDKVICNLLQVEEILSFEKMAYILGLNVENKPEEKRYVDYAEKEILEHSLESLVAFNMINTGDAHHSRCQLTATGKEYVAKGKKILPSEHKPFELFFDVIDGNHLAAKQRFGTAEFIPQLTSLGLEEELLKEESFLKSVAKVQIPKLYAPEELRDFINPELLEQEKGLASFKVAILVTPSNGSINFLAFDSHQQYNVAITKLINSQPTIQDQLLETLLLTVPTTNKALFSHSKQQLSSISIQVEIEELLAQNKLKQAFQKSKAFYWSLENLDPAFLELYMEQVFDENSKEFWMILPSISPFILEKIKLMVKQLQPANQLIIVVQEELEEELQTQLESYFTHPSVFFLTMAIQESPFLFLSKNGAEKWALATQEIPIQLKAPSKKIKLAPIALVKANSWTTAQTNLYKTCKKALALDYITKTQLFIQQQYHTLLQEESQLSKHQLQQIQQQVNKLSLFKKVSAVQERLQEVKKNYEVTTSLLKDILLTKIITVVEEVQEHYKSKTHHSKDQLKIFKQQLQEVKKDIPKSNFKEALKLQQLMKELTHKINATPPSKKKKYSQKRK